MVTTDDFIRGLRDLRNIYIVLVVVFSAALAALMADVLVPAIVLLAAMVIHCVLSAIQAHHDYRERTVKMVIDEIK